MTYVPNLFPTISAPVPYRIALCGEAPGADEVIAGRPFVGASGRLLDYLLNRVGIIRNACFLGNVCQVRPPDNKIENFPWNGEEIQHGLRQLATDLAEFRPNLVVCLGGTALRALKGSPDSITKWRGSLFAGSLDGVSPGTKCLACFHPASALRSYEQVPLVLFDLKRARAEGESATLRLPERTITVAQSVDDISLYFDRLLQHPTLVGTDIEGYVDNLTCISFAESPESGFVIPFTGGRGANYWNEVEELEVWTLLKGFLESGRVPFVLQHGLYDRFVLAYTYGILVCNAAEDTEAKHWELYCELKKALSLQASIYTKEPYYKDERDAETYEDHWQYNGKDSCVTLECCQKQEASLDPLAKQHYHFNQDMQNPLLYMELRGIRYDSAKARQRSQDVKAELYTAQHQLNQAAGCALQINSEAQALTIMRESFCFKRSQGLVLALGQILSHCKKAFLDDKAAIRALELCTLGYPFDTSRNGEFSMLTQRFLNTESDIQLPNFLYRTLGLPVQTNKKTSNETTEALALLKLFKLCERKASGAKDPEKAQDWINKSATLKLTLRVKNLRTQLETLTAPHDPDNRIRCSFNIVGTVTGRLSSSKSPTRTGYNLQTVTKKHRDLFVADEGHWLFQCDLSGADGWTVAARCAQLGDPTMLEDYIFGLKPAKLIALMRAGLNLSNYIREKLKHESLQITDKTPNPWLYMACKRVQHGSNYLMGKVTMSDQILEDSWKYGNDPIFVEPSICQELQNLYFQRYPGVLAYHRWIGNELKTRRQLVSAVGHTRRFFGRPNDHDTLKQACAHEPQIVTTYCTNRAALSLWNDPDNRTADNLFVVEPLHQVHDALIGQFPRDKVDWSCDKLRLWFASTQLLIAGQQITIPFEGAYGESWHPDALVHKI